MRTRPATSIMAMTMMFATLSLAAATGYKVLARYPVPGNGSFDYLTLDPAARRLYISHGTEVNVIEADTGKLVGTIPDTPGVHGIAIASEFKHGFTTNGGEGKVSMFDLATLQLIKKIDVGRGPDGVIYDPSTKRVFTNDQGSHSISAIDASTGEVVGTVKAEGNGEQAVIGADGLIYVNSENTDEVIVYDPKTLEVKKRFPIGAKTPSGLAYDPKSNRLFIGTHEPAEMVVMNAADGKVVATLPIGMGIDAAGFDPDARLVFLSCSDGTLNIFHEKSADEYEDAGAIQTQPSAKTMAFDPKTKKIFLSAADVHVMPPPEPGKRAPRVITPGSFVVVVVGK